MKTTFDIRKTMSYVEKIISDIIQTTSDVIFEAFGEKPSVSVLRHLLGRMACALYANA